MKIRMIYLIVVLSLFLSSVYSQIIKPPNRNVFQQYSRTITITNSSVSDYYHNSMFSTGQLKQSPMPVKIDFSLYEKYKFYNKPPLKIKDCVFFNPFDNYIINYKIEQNNTQYFYLNNIPLQIANKSNLVLPYSLRFYIDTAEVSIKTEQIEMNLDANFKVPFDKYLKPFYFRKYEVTNAEYREFVRYVRDSIAHVLLGEADDPELLGQQLIINMARKNDPNEDSDKGPYYLINWKEKIEWDDEVVQLILEDPNDGLFLPQYERFYRQKQIDPRRLNYEYYKEIDGKIIINVYPDTQAWVNDFSFGYNEPMAQNYFWHPAYNDYPVVGVNYHQTLAFLNWKTIQHQKELDAKGIKLKIEYDLPTEAEWDIAATAEFVNKKPSIFTKNYYYLSDNNWITDLCLHDSNKNHHIDSTIIDSTDFSINITHYKTKNINVLVKYFSKNVYHRSNLSDNGAFCTQNCKINKANKNKLTNWNKDELGICFMGGNVSEWLKESYHESWNPIFTKRQELLKTFQSEDAKILSQLEMYYDKRNHKDGKLVRGSNWWDERFLNKLGKNVEGMNAKLFVSPDSAHCTLGFRYVIHFTQY